MILLNRCRVISNLVCSRIFAKEVNLVGRWHITLEQPEPLYRFGVGHQILYLFFNSLVLDLHWFPPPTTVPTASIQWEFNNWPFLIDCKAPGPPGCLGV